MKEYIIFAGVNGTGKSTLYQTKKSLKHIPRINIDEITRGMGEWNDPKVVYEASKQAVLLLRKYFRQEITFNQETTLCGKSIINNILLAKQKGYTIEMHYVGVDNVEIAKERVAYRVKRGGHGIPTEDIERRYIESFKNLKKVMHCIDTLFLYDNSDKFHYFAIYRFGELEHIASDIPLWYKEEFMSKQ